MFSHKRKKGSRLVGYDEKEPIYLYEDAEKRDLAGDDLFPSIPKDYDFVLIGGPSGSGKTVWASRYIKAYKKKYPKRCIYVISSINEDNALDRISGVIRLDLEECFGDDDYEIEPESMQNSLVLFDDVDTLTSKKMRDNVLTFRDFLLEQGRHFNIHLVNTVHILLNYKATRRLLNESTKVIIFPKSGTAYQIKTFLQTYCGFMKEQITEFFKRDKKSRWKMISKTYPIYVMSQHEVYSV